MRQHYTPGPWKRRPPLPAFSCLRAATPARRRHPSNPRNAPLGPRRLCAHLWIRSRCPKMATTASGGSAAKPAAVVPGPLRCMASQAERSSSCCVGGRYRSKSSREDRARVISRHQPRWARPACAAAGRHRRRCLVPLQGSNWRWLHLNRSVQDAIILTLLSKPWHRARHANISSSPSASCPANFMPNQTVLAPACPQRCTCTHADLLGRLSAAPPGVIS